MPFSSPALPFLVSSALATKPKESVFNLPSAQTQYVAVDTGSCRRYLATLPTPSSDVPAPFSLSDTENQSSPSNEREIIPHHGTTYDWAQYDDPDELENVNRPCPGSYHPTHIGDKLHNDKYFVVHKLGHGTSSTVWLAQNTLIDGEYVALKILTADASKTTNEHNIRAHLQSKSKPQSSTPANHSCGS